MRCRILNAHPPRRGPVPRQKCNVKHVNNDVKELFVSRDAIVTEAEAGDGRAVVGRLAFMCVNYC